LRGALVRLVGLTGVRAFWPAAMDIVDFIT
jgi:hypothetical protein